MPEFDFIDLAHFQKQFPWNRARDAGVRGGIAKVMDGYFMPPDYKGHIDPRFEINWQALDSFDLRGAYGFNRFDVKRSGGLTPAMQMQLALDTIHSYGDHKETDILVWDVEEKPENIANVSLLARAQMLAEALKTAEKEWNKEYIWIYTGNWWWKPNMPAAHIDPMPYILSFKCWAAYYTRLKFASYMVPKGWTKDQVIAHQYSATKKIEGITVDHNEFLWDWDKYLKVEPSPPEPPAPPPDPPPEPPPETPKPPTTDPKGCLPAILDLFRPR